MTRETHWSFPFGQEIQSISSLLFCVKPHIMHGLIIFLCARDAHQMNVLSTVFGQGPHNMHVLIVILTSDSYTDVA